MEEGTSEKKLRQIEDFSEKAASLAPHEVIELLHQLCDIPEGTEISLPNLDDFPDDDPNDPELKIFLEREEELRQRKLNPGS